MRQAAGKVAAGLLPMLSPEDHNLASLIRISEQLVAYFRDGVQWQVPPQQQPSSRQPQQQQYAATRARQQPRGATRTPASPAADRRRHPILET